MFWIMISVCRAAAQRNSSRRLSRYFLKSKLILIYFSFKYSRYRFLTIIKLNCGDYNSTCIDKLDSFAKGSTYTINIEFHLFAIRLGFLVAVQSHIRTLTLTHGLGPIQRFGGCRANAIDATLLIDLKRINTRKDKYGFKKGAPLIMH